MLCGCKLCEVYTQMSSSGSPHASSHAERQPQEIVNGVDPLVGGVSKRAPRRDLRRSWYSLTFSDEECDDDSDRRLPLARTPDEEEEGSRGAAGLAAAPRATCRAADTDSDASTDVGSDDEEGGKCLDDFDLDEARSRPSSGQHH